MMAGNVDRDSATAKLLICSLYIDIRSFRLDYGGVVRLANSGSG